MLNRLLSRYWLLLPLFVLVVVVSQIEEPTEFTVEETINMRETRSDYYMSEFRSRKFNREGLLEYTVQGSTLAHYPQNDRSEITAPRIELFRPGTQWRIQSNNGIFAPNPDLFTLQGDVIVNRIADGNEPVTIRTSTLSIATESNEVSSDAKIEISSPRWQLQAKGLKSAIDQGKLTLLADVIGRYEAPGL